MAFCPYCKIILIPVAEGFRCPKCGHVSVSIETSEIVHEPMGRERLVIDRDTTVLPTTRVECPNCGHNEAYWMLRQTRAADEPETRIYRCTKCEYTWREY